MKTFKLKALEIIENANEEIVQHTIPLLEGLIINREDNDNRWVIEAYMENERIDFFKELREQNEEIMVQVKITKASNSPATFITSIIGLNEIGDQMNVLFMGTIVDKRKEIVEGMLKQLIDDGYHGDELLDKFKELI